MTYEELLKQLDKLKEDIEKTMIHVKLYKQMETKEFTKVSYSAQEMTVGKLKDIINKEKDLILDVKGIKRS